MNNILNWLHQNLIIIFVNITVLLIIFTAFKLGVIAGKFKMEKTLKEVREDAVKRSKAVMGGLMAEQMAPFLPKFPCNPADCRFIGKPIDFIAFPGASENEEVKEILLIEVKTGESQLSPREKQIRDCVKQGKIRYIEYRLE